MRKSKRFALRFLMLSAALLALTVVFGARPATTSPYLSALSDLTAASTYAATVRCSHTRCQSVKCVGTGQRTDCATDGVTCSTFTCRF